MTSLRQLVDWIYQIDMRDEKFSFAIFSDWLEDHGETKLARGFRLVAAGKVEGDEVTAYEPDNNEADVLWEDDGTHPRSFDWFDEKRNPRKGYSVPRAVLASLRGGAAWGDGEVHYREYPSRSAAFFALAEVLAELDEET